MTEKNAVLRSFFDPCGAGLEIGPQSRGVAPKRDGYNCKIVDYAPQARLQALHTETPNTDVSSIEPVDYVTDGGPLREVISGRHCFDYIIASHVIEHVPDLLGFLKDCASLLKHDGRLVLAVPDKRFIFDAFRPLTSVGEVMQIHATDPRRHPASKILDYWAYVVRRNGQIIWNPDNIYELELIHPLSEARRQFDIARSTTDYIDNHVWIFTPSSFRLLVNDLFELSEISLRECCYHCESDDGPKTPEFYIALSGHGGGPGLTRNDLMRSTLKECRIL